MSCSHFTFIFIFFLLISLSLIWEELRILAKRYIFLTRGYKINRFMGEGMGGQAVSGRVRKLTPDLPKGKKKKQVLDPAAISQLGEKWAMLSPRGSCGALDIDLTATRNWYARQSTPQSLSPAAAVTCVSPYPSHGPSIWYRYWTFALSRKD